MNKPLNSLKPLMRAIIKIEVKKLIFNIVLFESVSWKTKNREF